MTRSLNLIIAIVFVAALSLVFPARGQGVGQSPERALEEMNAARDAAIEANADAITERAEVDAVIGAEIIDIKKRLDALEEAGPVEPPVEPETPWPLSLVNLDTGEITPIDGLAISAPMGEYTILIGENASDESATLDAAPFVTKINGAACVEAERFPVYHICGNNEPAPFFAGDNPVTIEGQGTGETVSLTVTLIDDAPPTGPPGEARLKFQGGPHYPSNVNIEEPYLNLMHAFAGVWEGGGKTTGDLLDEGVLDPATMLPKYLPGGRSLLAGYFLQTDNSALCAAFDGEWLLEWEGDADFRMFMDRAYWRRDGPNRISITRDCTGGATPDHIGIFLDRLDTPLTALRLYRAENEALVRAGGIYSPRLLSLLEGYDIVRPMNLQAANVSVIRSVDDMPSMAAPYWAAADYSAAGGEPQFRFGRPFQGMPLAAVFALGVDTGKELWLQAPITLGAPAPLFDFEGDDPSLHWAARFSDAAKDDAVNVIESEEWDRYADAFVEALIASGYPADRPLYVALANEVWNFAGEYFLTTTYAQRMGWGLAPWLEIPEHNGLREGYGALSARFKLALDGALERAGRDQDLTYVIEGQAAYVELTGAALRGAKAYMDKKGERWADHAPGFGVSVASYWGYTDPARYNVDVNDFDALEDFFLNGGENQEGTRANVLKLFRGAAAQGAQYGVKLIGAYEGGSHLGRPSGMSEEDYFAFLWGEPGGRINYEINRALAEAFPGIILSNYILAGPAPGMAFIEGPSPDANPLAQSWPRLIDDLKGVGQ